MSVALALMLSLAACGSSRAPSCDEVASRALERTLASARYDKLPERVQDSLRDNRHALEKQTAASCETRGWSSQVRRCKYNADSDAEAAACDDPRR